MYALIDHLTINGINVYLRYDNLDDAWLISPFAMQDGRVSLGLCGDWNRRNLEEEDLARYPEAIQRMRDTGMVDISLGLTLLTPRAQLERVAALNDEDTAPHGRGSMRRLPRAARPLTPTSPGTC